MARLRAMPHFQPSPTWRRRTLLRLLAQIEREPRRAPSHRCWAIYATNDPDPVQFADSVASRGGDWRPLAVQPERLQSAVANLQPQLVVIDPRLPRAKALARMVQAASFAESAISQAA